MSKLHVLRALGIISNKASKLKTTSNNFYLLDERHLTSDNYQNKDFQVNISPQVLEKKADLNNII